MVAMARALGKVQGQCNSSLRGAQRRSNPVKQLLDCFAILAMMVLDPTPQPLDHLALRGAAEADALVAGDARLTYRELDSAREIQ